MQSADDTSGLTQPMADVELVRPEAPSLTPAPGLSAGAPSLRSVPLQDLQLYLESGTLRHFEQVQAVAAQDPRLASVAVTMPADIGDLTTLLGRQGYRVDSRDPWTVLGLSPLCGTEPTEMDIASRARDAALLLSLAEGDGWDQADRDRAAHMRTTVAVAAARCEEGLEDVRRSRRQLRPDRLPRWKELGGDAMAAVLATPHAGASTFITQWSQVLDPRGGHAQTVAQQRRSADLLEKGDAKFLTELQGKKVVAWAPAEAGALQRILSQFLRLDAGAAPTALLLLVPLRSFPVSRG